MENKKPILTGKALRKPSLIAAVLLTALSLSACVLAPERGGYRGDGHRNHWSNDWHGGAGWQGGGGWDHHH
jgi:hypothetical protein